MTISWYHSISWYYPNYNFLKLHQGGTLGKWHGSIHWNSCLTCCRNLLSNFPTKSHHLGHLFPCLTTPLFLFFSSALAIFPPALATMTPGSIISTQKPEWTASCCCPLAEGQSRRNGSQMQGPPPSTRAEKGPFFPGGGESSISRQQLPLSGLCSIQWFFMLHTEFHVPGNWVRNFGGATVLAS